MEQNDLITDFKEKEFMPTKKCENPEEYAKNYRKMLEDKLYALQNEIITLNCENNRFFDTIKRLDKENNKLKQVVYTLAILQSINSKPKITDIKDLKAFLSDLGIIE